MLCSITKFDQSHSQSALSQIQFDFISNSHRFVFIPKSIGLSGCWRRSAGAITATAILMLLTCLLAAGAMGLWHTVEFFEKEKVVGEEFYQQWTKVLRDNTRISYDWSYVLAWAGVASSLVAAILLSGAAVCLRSEREKEEQLNLQYLMPGTVYIRNNNNNNNSRRKIFIYISNEFE